MFEKNEQYNRTDLALELHEEIENEKEINGIEIYESEEKNGIRQTHIRVSNQNGERLLGKPIGNYITIEGQKLQMEDLDIHKPFVDCLYKVIKQLIGDARKILVIGLGNRAVTPDALGPLVVDHLYITRHLLKEGIINQAKELSAICPGVLAQTGIESSVIIHSICQEINPNIVIVIDALAARNPERLNTTIQVCDTGIVPGAGIGNRRIAINKESLGIPVVAIGVPTVISVHTITRDKLPSNMENMFVTPKNIDEIVNRVSYTISEAINRLL